MKIFGVILANVSVCCFQGPLLPPVMVVCSAENVPKGLCPGRFRWLTSQYLKMAYCSFSSILN